jgi:hypothetical protein
MIAWQPIETAPKDGTRILIYSHGAYVAHWEPEACFYQFEKKPGWQIFDCEDGFYSCATDTATHWMPLPEKPE